MRDELWAIGYEIRVGYLTGIVKGGVYVVELDGGEASNEDWLERIEGIREGIWEIEGRGRGDALFITFMSKLS